VCEQHPEPIHLLLTDVVMPQMSGSELVGRIAQLRPGIKALFMSGYTDDAVVRHGVLSTGTPFLQKPFTPNRAGTEGSRSARCEVDRSRALSRATAKKLFRLRFRYNEAAFRVSWSRFLLRLQVDDNRRDIGALKVPHERLRRKLDVRDVLAEGTEVLQAGRLLPNHVQDIVLHALDVTDQVPHHLHLIGRTQPLRVAQSCTQRLQNLKRRSEFPCVIELVRTGLANRRAVDVGDGSRHAVGDHLIAAEVDGDSARPSVHRQGAVRGDGHAAVESQP